MMTIVSELQLAGEYEKGMLWPLEIRFSPPFHLVYYNLVDRTFPVSYHLAKGVLWVKRT